MALRASTWRAGGGLAKRFGRLAARDAARDGAVDAVAFQTAYDLLRDGASPSTGLAAAFDAQAEHALNMMDADREGTVNVDDFLAWWASAKHGEHMLV